MANSIKWSGLASCEETLKDFGVPFTVGEIAVNDIDREASRLNHARIGGPPIDPGLVEEYALSYESGDTFPRVVVRKHGRKYVVVDGNHRVEAADLFGVKFIEAYIADVGDDEAIMDLLPRAFNRKAGRRTSKDEGYMHAIHAIDKYGYTLRKAAAAFGVSEKALGNRIAISATRERLVQLGVEANKMTDDSMKQLSPFNDNDHVLAAAGQVICRAKLTSKDVNSFLAKVKEERTENARIGVIAAFEQKYGVNGKQEAKRTQKKRKIVFMRALTGMETLLDRGSTLNKFQITEQEEKRHVAERLADLGQKCQRLARSV